MEYFVRDKCASEFGVYYSSVGIKNVNSGIVCVCVCCVVQLQNANASYADVWLIVYEDGIAILDRQTMVTLHLSVSVDFFTQFLFNVMSFLFHVVGNARL